MCKSVREVRVEYGRNSWQEYLYIDQMGAKIRMGYVHIMEKLVQAFQVEKAGQRYCNPRQTSIEVGTAQLCLSTGTAISDGYRCVRRAWRISDTLQGQKWSYYQGIYAKAALLNDASIVETRLNLLMMIWR